MTKLQSSANNIPIQPLSPDQLAVSHHVWYFSTCLVSSSLPAPYKSLDTNRLTLVHFAVQSLDVLNSLDKTLDSETKHHVINWIYVLFITLTTRDENPAISDDCRVQRRDIYGTILLLVWFNSNHDQMNHGALIWAWCSAVLVPLAAALWGSIFAKMTLKCPEFSKWRHHDLVYNTLLENPRNARL